jgi:formylglycine-generating enzyme required for sulfatase activity
VKQLALFLLLIAPIFGEDTVSAPAQRGPGTVFRDCPECPEMVVIPAGKFSMGSSASDQSWAVSHGATPGSVFDESPQHSVSLRCFALGKYDVMRGEYAVFVHETGYLEGDGCGHDGEKWNKQGICTNGRKRQRDAKEVHARRSGRLLALRVLAPSPGHAREKSR